MSFSEQKEKLIGRNSELDEGRKVRLHFYLSLPCYLLNIEQYAGHNGDCESHFTIIGASRLSDLMEARSTSSFQTEIR